MAWALLIFGVSSVPGPRLPEVELLRHDKALHALLYAPLGAVILLGLQRRLKVRPVFLFALAVVLVGFYGITDELHQMFVPGRSADSHDVVADLVGGALGAGAAWFGKGLVRTRGGHPKPQ